MLLKQMAYYCNNKYLILGLTFLAFLFNLSCKEKESEQNVKEDELVMYQPSEMANLMNAFYVYNEALKEAINTGSELPEMPEYFDKIHTAKMTDKDGRTPIFQSFAPLYLDAQKAIKDTLDREILKQRYNATINLCISCHQTECVGPIPRIKKLIIN
ncbi:hypothetical protein [Winogradskyella sp. 3972H.M.0a.05]|uniref:hypothetical protein n=1 Tax=Winogradskyella sp. 3972H.M.0a.05 TaxID=2950277 RepID=UPI0033940216